MSKEDTEFSYYQCPTCGWDSCNHDGPIDGVLIAITDFYYGYEGSKSWVEHFVCPDCDTEFEVENGT